MVINLPRRFDYDSAPLIENELRAAIGRHPEQVLFDFTRTEYISSAGVKVLLSTAHSLKDRGGQVALSSLCHQVLYILEIAGFTRIFTIYETRDKAIRHMKKEHS